MFSCASSHWNESISNSQDQATWHMQNTVGNKTVLFVSDVNEYVPF